MIYTIYGKPKVGKTTLALKDAPPGKTAIIDADRGLLGVDTKDITIISDTSINNLNKEVLSPTFLKRHTRIIVDTVTSLYESFLLEASDGKTPSRNNYGQANNALSGFIRALRIEDKEVIILGQEKLVFPDEEWTSDDVDEESPVSVSIDLPPGATKSLMSFSDVICRLYIANVNNKYARRLWLATTPNIIAGARSSVYSGHPAFLKSPTISRLNNILGWKTS